MKVVSVVGTRPNFIKEYAFHHACLRVNLEKILVNTGQHSDYEMSALFFDELDIPPAKYVNEIVKGSQGKETAAMLAFLEEVLLEEAPDVVLVYGDVNSSLAAALAAVKLGIPVAHVEAGIRSAARYNSEEINRRVVDVVSELLFPNTQDAYEALIAEGYSKENMFGVGDIVKDSLDTIVRQFGIRCERSDYCLVTMHRAENVDNPTRIAAIVEGLVRSGRRMKFPLHPRTRKRLIEFRLWDQLERAPNIELLPPMSYVDFVRLLAGAGKVLTDSGGVRREAYILGKPVISLIDIVWVPAMLRTGWKYVADADSAKIVDAVERFEPDGPRPPIFGDGRAAERIVDILVERYGG